MSRSQGRRVQKGDRMAGVIYALYRVPSLLLFTVSSCCGCSYLKWKSVDVCQSSVTMKSLSGRDSGLSHPPTCTCTFPPIVCDPAYIGLYTYVHDRRYQPWCVDCSRARVRRALGRVCVGRAGAARPWHRPAPRQGSGCIRCRGPPAGVSGRTAPPSCIQGRRFYCQHTCRRYVDGLPTSR